MTRRIFRSIFLMSVIVLVFVVVVFISILYNRFSKVEMAQLKVQTDMVTQGVNLAGIEYLNDLKQTEYRITWVAEDGTVLYDNYANSEDMENHLEREEIQSAFQLGFGESRRYSNTLLQESLYYAEKTANGNVIRLSVFQNSIVALLLEMAQPIILVTLFILLVSAWLAIKISKSIVEPLNKLDLDHPLENEEYDEISPLLHRIDSQKKSIEKQEITLEQRKKEFDIIIESMNEGLLLINAKDEVISINNSAQNILNIDGNPIGKELWYCCHIPEFRRVVIEAQKERNSRGVMEIFGNKYQINVSAIFHQQQYSGMVVLLFDITDREMSEQIRREFTANVSHELKNPLHSIIGHSELMVNNMVKPEDYPVFAQNIHEEASRLIHLVEDIIRLSHLDEGAKELAWQEIHLKKLVEDVVHSLENEANKAEVSLKMEVEEVSVYGVPQLLQSIIYNLCDNAIKYNHKSGEVLISVKEMPDTIVLSVQDTGIGIPLEHQKRVFERFYRVDKSHSKELGGTGLGLSIVKHAAQVHNAKIELFSEKNQGTTIVVKFPKGR